MDESPARPEAPVLLLTKLHPPFVPAQTIARERPFERLRAGRDLRLSLAAEQGEVVLVLDDVHRLSSPSRASPPPRSSSTCRPPCNS